MPSTAHLDAPADLGGLGAVQPREDLPRGPAAGRREPPGGLVEPDAEQHVVAVELAAHDHASRALVARNARRRRR